MKSLRLHTVLPLVALAITAPVIAAVRISPVHPERLKLSPTDRRDAVFADLDEILTGPASTDSIATKPYLSLMQGLCRRDVVSISYARSGGSADRNSQLKPQGIRAVYPQYHFIGEDNARSEADWKRACTQLSGDKVYWALGKDDDRAAYNALVALHIAVSAARDNKEIKFDCTQLSDTSENLNCASEFLSAAEKVRSFDSSQDQNKIGGNFSTWKYDISIEIVFNGSKRTINVKLTDPEIIET